MGDVGSQYLGFLFATLAVAVDAVGGVAASLVALAFLPFVLDVTVTLAVRAARRAPLREAHREHAYQKLVLAGWSHARTTALYGALSAAVVIGVLVTVRTGTHGWLWWVLAVPTVLVVVGARIRA
jgi:UDP-N-acetylmuramyl pentapeptide phosphotransferase/UDP-N-acetylglucosamine-1-phosphate transferase